MKKLILLLVLYMIVAHSFAQTTTQPAAAELSEFKSIKTFMGNGAFQLPKGVTRIMVEVWGAGAGGSSVGGGGGGAYGKAILNVADGSRVTVTVGTGGRGGQTGNFGMSSSVNYSPSASPASTYVFMARGGRPATLTNNIAQGGDGGEGASPTGNDVGFYSLPGEDGQLFNDVYDTGAITRSFGTGGNAANSLYTGGRGSVILNPNSPSFIRYGTEGKAPGGGGGGGHLGGYNGGNGLVIIHY